MRNVLVLFIVCITCPLVVFAQDSSPDKRYLIEFIMFRYINTDIRDGEIWDKVNMAPIEDRNPANTNRKKISRDIEYVDFVHSYNTFLLIRNDPKYEVLSQVAWLQHVNKKAESFKVPVSKYEGSQYSRDKSTHHVGSENKLFDGFVKIYGSRLLYVELQLSYNDAASSFYEASNYGQSKTSIQSNTYFINETRRIKLDELNYFDHPNFGALIKVTRAENDYEKKPSSR